MNRAKLDWFQLRFPRGLDDKAALAALTAFSGLPHRHRLRLDVVATAGGIVHVLAVDQRSVESVTASLRAAIPSLRLEAIEPEPRVSGVRTIWQLSPRLGVLRTDALAAASAALLSCLFPLRSEEAICLSWHIRSAARPVPPRDDEGWPGGRLSAVRSKLAAPGGMAVYGELVVMADDRKRRGRLFQRVASVLRSLSTPYGRLVGEPLMLGLPARWLGFRGRFVSSLELAALVGWPIEAMDLPGLELGAAKRLVPSAALARSGRLLGDSDFTGLTRPVALTAKASTKSLYILGPTGTGKTTLLKNLIVSDLEQGRGLVALETNGDVIQELTDLIPKARVKDVVLLDATDQDFAVGLNPFASSAEPALIADQLGELFQRLWAAYWGPRTAQLTHMGLLTLARRKGSTLLDLPRLYQDPAFRASVLAGRSDPLGLDADWRWFESLSEAEQVNVVSPLLNKARQWVSRPAIRAIVGQSQPKLTMRQIVAERKVLLVHMPKGLIGAETAQLLGCLVLTVLWQAMTERAALAPSKRHPFGLYVDEVQDLAAAPLPWDEALAQGRKYGLALTVAHQNLGQLPKGLKEVLLANARSKVAFTLSEPDAKVMEKLFSPALSAADLGALDAYSVGAILALDDGSIARPVTLKTNPPPAPLGSSAEVKASSRRRYARSKEEIDAALVSLAEAAEPDTGPIGVRPRKATS